MRKAPLRMSIVTKNLYVKGKWVRHSVILLVTKRQAGVVLHHVTIVSRNPHLFLQVQIQGTHQQKSKTDVPAAP